MRTEVKSRTIIGSYPQVSQKNRGVEPKIGGFYRPKWMVKIMVPNPMNKWDDLEVPLFLETPIYTQAAANGSFWKKHTRKQQLQRVVLLFLLFGWGKCVFFLHFVSKNLCKYSLGYSRSQWHSSGK